MEDVKDLVENFLLNLTGNFLKMDQQWTKSTNNNIADVFLLTVCISLLPDGDCSEQQPPGSYPDNSLIVSIGLVSTLRNRFRFEVTTCYNESTSCRGSPRQVADNEQ